MIRRPRTVQGRRDAFVSTASFVVLCAVTCGSATLCGQASPAPSAQTLPGTTIENWQEISPRLSSGSQPTTDADFAELARRGVRAVVSVDGLKPDVDLARKHGLRYVHIPIGYDGLPQIAGETMTHAMRSVDGRVFVHCHHGKHRGPAMAAVAGRACGALTEAQALDYLKTAGLSPKYPGLWRDVRAFVVPPENAELPSLVESAPVSDLVERMADLARHHEALEKRLARQATFGEDDWTTAESESLLALEQLKESLRELPESSSDFNTDRRFQHLLSGSVASAEDLHGAVRARNRSSADRAAAALGKSCVDCHAAYR